MCAPAHKAAPLKPAFCKWASCSLRRRDLCRFSNDRFQRNRPILASTLNGNFVPNPVLGVGCRVAIGTEHQKIISGSRSADQSVALTSIEQPTLFSFRSAARLAHFRMASLFASDNLAAA